MLTRALVALAALSVPAEAQAAGYVVHRGDTLSAIAQQSHVSVYALAQANGITNPNTVRAGQVLFLPAATWGYGYQAASSYGYSRSAWSSSASAAQPASAAVTAYSAPYGSYRVQWGDTLSGLALRFHTTVAALRASNPSLGTYLIAGPPLSLCTSCASTSVGAGQSTGYSYSPSQSAAPYAPQPASVPAQGYAVWGSNAYSGYQAQSLIAAYARQYGLESSLPLAIGAEESNFQQSAVSRTGALGVMQVEPDTARQISALMGRPVNLYSMDDNIHAGVFWLAHLVAQYGGNERLAAAAYYQGSPSIASHGFYSDTNGYVSRAMSLKTRYGG